MQFKTLALTALCSTVASALPLTQEIADGAPFTLQTILPDRWNETLPIQAALRSLFVDLPAQNATCSGSSNSSDTNHATFTLKNQELHLYSCESTAASQTNQTIFVDRSGMGMGKIGYITGSDGLGRYWETAGWTIDSEGALAFKGTGLQACPNSWDGAWSVWLRGSTMPGWNEGCVEVGVVARKSEGAVSCVYSTEIV